MIVLCRRSLQSILMQVAAKLIYHQYEDNSEPATAEDNNMEQSCKIVEEKRQIIKQLINTEVEEES